MLSKHEYDQIDTHFRVRLASGSINAPTYDGRIARAQTAVQTAVARLDSARLAQIKRKPGRPKGSRHSRYA